MPKLTKKQLEAITEYGELQFTTSEVSIILDIPLELIQGEEGLKAFLKGRYRAEAIKRKANFELVQSGSPQAIKLMDQYHEESKEDLEIE